MANWWYCAYSFARNWQLPFLNQRKGENDRRKYFMINLHERMLPTSQDRVARLNRALPLKTLVKKINNFFSKSVPLASRSIMCSCTAYSFKSVTPGQVWTTSIQIQEIQPFKNFNQLRRRRFGNCYSSACTYVYRRVEKRFDTGPCGHVAVYKMLVNLSLPTPYWPPLHPNADIRASWIVLLAPKYSRPSIARTPMARLPWLIRTRFWVPTKFFR